MLTRGVCFALLALCAALGAASGLLGGMELWAWSTCYVFIGLTLLSLLFSLFEEVDVKESKTVPLPLESRSPAEPLFRPVPEPTDASRAAA